MIEDRREKTLEQKLLSWIAGISSAFLCAITYQVFINIPEQNTKLLQQIAALGEKFALRSEFEVIKGEVKAIRSRQDERTTTIDTMQHYLRSQGMRDKGFKEQ